MDLKKEIKKLAMIILDAHTSLLIYEAIKEARAPNILGKDIAIKNSNTMNAYGIFFNRTAEAHYHNAVLKIAHLLDTNKLSFSIHNLIKKFEDKQEYKDEIEKFKTNKDQNLIDQIKIVRDQYIAHNDKNKDAYQLNVQKLLDLIQNNIEILDYISYKNFNTRYIYETTNTKSDIHDLISDLTKYHDVRNMIHLLCKNI